MPEGYGTHRDYIERVDEAANARFLNVASELRAAFPRFIEVREVEVVVFSGMTVHDLTQAIKTHPLILKGLLVCCNIGGRAIARDLGITVDTYEPRLTDEVAANLAGYIKPFLPPYLELPAIAYIDRLSYIDKEIRKVKGSWEKIVRKAANRHGQPRTFKKYKFQVDEDTFELDAASVAKNGDVEIGIDVKRIEARQDIHKRCDEIVNKAAKLKTVYPGARFGAVIYYPFIDEHSNLQRRLTSPDIDGIVFASESTESVDTTVKLLLSMLGIDVS